MTNGMSLPFQSEPVSNGSQLEQAMIRRWWHETHQARGRLVWEYYIEGRYVDAIWFPNADEDGVEHSGLEAPKSFPIDGEEIVICEAKRVLNPELIGQAIVYTHLARKAGATVRETIVFAEIASRGMQEVTRAQELCLKTVVRQTLE